MPIKYPKVEPYAVRWEWTKENEDEAELDCGCLMKDHEDYESTEFYFCTLHNTAQQLLDALDRVAMAAYRGFAAAATIGCVFCNAVQTSVGLLVEHDQDCPMDLVHQVIRRAKGGESATTG